MIMAPFNSTAKTARPLRQKIAELLIDSSLSHTLRKKIYELLEEKYNFVRQF